jgi:alkanesulfonate monooxygenase SsuD/methylene tetrahydromethanopterin reductase-like flavin-dependent oxidoreductase (luciferase family)
MARKAGDLGLFGAWLNPRYPDGQRIEFGAELEELGFCTIWLGVGGKAVGDLRVYEAALRATREATIVPAIINMWQELAEIVAEGYPRVRSEFGDRFLLGLGAGHPEANAGYERPYAKLADYLDRLDDSGGACRGPDPGRPVPEDAFPGRRAQRGRPPVPDYPGPHPRRPRDPRPQVLMCIPAEKGPLLAPEHKVVASADPGHARSIGRPMGRDAYLSLRNCTNNMRTEIAWPILRMAG